MSRGQAGKMHITPTGPKKCEVDESNPRSRGCDYAADGHYEDPTEAQAVYDRKMESEFDVYRPYGQTSSPENRDKVDRRLRGSAKSARSTKSRKQVAVGLTMLAVFAGSFAFTAVTQQDMTCEVTAKHISTRVANVTINKSASASSNSEDGIPPPLRRGDRGKPIQEQYVLETANCGTLEIQGGVTNLFMNKRQAYIDTKVGQSYKMNTWGTQIFGFYRGVSSMEAVTS